MADKILGIDKDTFYAFLFILLLIILGIVSFHYYIYISGGDSAALRAGTGIGFALFPNKSMTQMRQDQQQKAIVM